MNRKMRAKLNNQTARKSKERKVCSKAGQVIESATEHCDECGEQLARVVALVVEKVPPKEKLH